MNAYTIFLVDDDAGVRKALTRMLTAAGFHVLSFASSQQFLRQHDPAVHGCLLLDLAMPEVNGLELQETLLQSGCERYIIFLTACGDIPSSVRAMKAGAVDFLTKPADRGDLLRAIGTAIVRDRQSRMLHEELRGIEHRLETLTPREHEVMQHVVSGQLNKQIAFDLGTSEKTIKVHRARVMQKMGVQSLADLVRVAARLGSGLRSTDSHRQVHPAGPVLRALD